MLYVKCHTVLTKRAIKHQYNMIFLQLCCVTCDVTHLWLTMLAKIGELRILQYIYYIPDFDCSTHQVPQWA